MGDEKWYRGVPGVGFIWHGEWSDPEVTYKGHSFCYWDLDEALSDFFRTDFEEEFPEMVIAPEDYPDFDEDEAFQDWVDRNHETVIGVLEDWILAQDGEDKDE